jgi:flagellar motor switch protein FliM
MTLVSAQQTIDTASLIRAADPNSYPGLDRVGHKLARGTADFLSGLIGLPARVSPSAARIEECGATDLITRRLILEPMSGVIELRIERSAVTSFVDLYYGGDGADRDEPREELSPAENRLLARLAETLCSLLPAAWLPYGTISCRLDEDAALQSGRMAVQTLSLGFANRTPLEISLCYPVQTLELFPEIQLAEPAQRDQRLSDGNWQAGLMARAADIPFNVRAIFAEPEVPLAKLMNLRIGDIIPVCLPAGVELILGGLSLGRGSAGESNGRAAVAIDHL